MVSFLPTVIYRVSATPIKIQRSFCFVLFFVGSNKLFLQFKWKLQGHGITRSRRKENAVEQLHNFNSYCGSTVIRECLCKGKQVLKNE